MKKIILVALLTVICLMVLAGCNDSDTKTSEDTSKSNKQTTGIDPKSELKGFFNMERNYFVKYEMKIDSSEASKTYLATYYYVGKNFRYDVTEGDVEMRMIMKDNNIYSCTNPKSKWTCMKLAEYEPSSEEKIREEIDSYKVEYIGTKSFAEKTAKCYMIEANDMTMEYCITNEAVPVYWRTSNKFESIEVKAIQVGKASEADLALPAEPQDMSNYEELMRQYQTNIE